MTVTTTGVRLAPPPPALMRMVNPLVRRVLANERLGRRIALQALLEFTGRHSGRRLLVPVCLHEIDGVPTVFTERPWRLNFTARAPVVVTQRGRVRNGHAVLLPVTPGERGAAMRQALDNGATPFELGLKVARGHTPTAEELSAVPRSLIRVDFTEE
ncbi:grhN [Nocardia sp. NPDC057227]|uniref:grhN n=1 Tax=Nocardia sp. NPDC057227 TaxID=3346056 RepID=UPI00362E5914